MQRKLWKRVFAGAAAACLLLVVVSARPAFHLLRTIWNDTPHVSTANAGEVNDASKLNGTAVAQVWTIPGDPAQAERQLIELTQYARSNGLKISVAGARHSMGGHSIAEGGIVVDMLPFNRMQLDETNAILHVQAGARWSEVIPFLNERGFAVAIMQSNDDFSVGGSISVNCHGWQFNRPPIASTVRSFRLLLADGRIVKCSRQENPELFSLALGGYGLFGIILDADLEVVRNERYDLQRLHVMTSDLPATLMNLRDAELVYGRLKVTRDGFLSETLLNVFRRADAASPVISTLGEVQMATLKRSVFRGSVGNEYGKRLRWWAEKYLEPEMSGKQFERNALFFVPSSLFRDQSPDRTDILVECFVPFDTFALFVGDLKRIIPKAGADLLNATVRQVNADSDTFLRYADTNMIATVMLFSQKRTREEELRMEKVAQEIVTAALNRGGRYYLPYRLHATPEQFQRCYPQASRFFDRKRHFDPEELFQNGFYRRYGT